MLCLLERWKWTIRWWPPAGGDRTVETPLTFPGSFEIAFCAGFFAPLS